MTDQQLGLILEALEGIRVAVVDVESAVQESNRLLSGTIRVNTHGTWGGPR